MFGAGKKASWDYIISGRGYDKVSENSKYLLISMRGNNSGGLDLDNIMYIEDFFNAEFVQLIDYTILLRKKEK